MIFLFFKSFFNELKGFKYEKIINKGLSELFFIPLKDDSSNLFKCLSIYLFLALMNYRSEFKRFLLLKE